jgi:3',5'-cyclic AMP phosphodiesterase CpdA
VTSREEDDPVTRDLLLCQGPAGGVYTRGMLAIFHMSDTHVRSNLRPNKHEAEYLTRIVEKLVAYKSAARQDPPTEFILMHTGDLTQHGTEREYVRAVEILRPLKKAGFKLLMTPGNHDCGQLGNHYTEARHVNFQRHVLGDLMGFEFARTATNRMSELYPMIHRYDGVTFVGLDSMGGRTEHAGRMAMGCVGAPQRDKLTEIVRDLPASEPLVVYLHHHPFDRGFGLKLLDSEELMAIVRPRARVLCFGHKHEEREWAAEDSPTRLKHGPIYASGKSTNPDGAHWPVREILINPLGTVTSRLPLSV